MINHIIAWLILSYAAYLILKFAYEIRDDLGELGLIFAGVIGIPVLLLWCLYTVFH